jgi:nicotinamide-nucleotide amidase
VARPTAAVLVTGSEILLGLTRDRNSGFLGRGLDALGIDLRRVLTVGDAEEDLARALGELRLHDLIVTSGGLGPTHDDRTVAVVAAVAGVPLVLHEPTLEAIRERTAIFARQRGLDPESFVAGNRKQALVPEGADVLGPVGTAPGLLVELGPSLCVVLPGPPSELERLWRVLPERPAFAALLERAGHLQRRMLRVFGQSESAVADAFAAAGGDGGGTLTTICARRLEIEILIRAEPSKESAFERLLAGLRERLGTAIYAEDERPLEAHVVERLHARGWTAATAESCTGGLVAARLTEVPGASDVLLGGVVAYANEVKRDVLGVPDALLRDVGAVSADAAKAMAEGVRRVTRADAGVAVTGIAGPDGGTPEKPVGLVYLHVSSPAGDAARRIVFPGARTDVQQWAATTALHMLRQAAAG